MKIAFLPLLSFKLSGRVGAGFQRRPSGSAAGSHRPGGSAVGSTDLAVRRQGHGDSRAGLY
ncbi:MAG: hypothetical protein GX900_00165 [Clostridiaceae bacterium]|nr:hypothetical protein [Clostridiaceae bacterium]